MSEKGLCRQLAAGLLTAIMLPGAASAAMIHADPFPGDFSAPRTFPVHFAFMTSWDGIEWTDEQMDVARAAISHIGIIIRFDRPFREVSGEAPVIQGNDAADPPAFVFPDFTLRWAGEDFFRNWPETDPEFFEGMSEAQRAPYRFGNSYALTYKPDPDNPPPVPWDPARYPANEIYFNTGEAWSFNLFGVDEFRLDFWSVLMHEVVHMLSVRGHSDNPKDLMYPEIEYGERKWLTASDRQMLRDVGVPIIPLPPAGLLLLSALALGAAGGAMRRRRAA